MDVYGDVAKNSSNYVGYPHYWNVSPFEKNYNFAEAQKWLNRNWHVSLYISVAYLAVVYVLQRYMRPRRPVDIRRPFMWWNFALAVFSTGGMCRALPELVYVVRNYGVEFSVCNSKTNSVTGLWITLFTFSKAVELVDTVFLLLRKRLTFLHLAHHVITLLVTWHFMMDTPALARWTYTLNFTVHAFMYTYFAVKATNIRIPEFVSFGITSMQILQFVIGLFTSVFCFNLIYSGTKCNTSYGVAITTVFTNVFFLYVFGKFFVIRYFIKVSKGKVE